METVSRKTAHRGLQVTLTERNGTVWTGTLDGWGAQLVVIRPDEETQIRTGIFWKAKSFPSFLVTVTR